jgi:hypothetical protein
LLVFKKSVAKIFAAFPRDVRILQCLEEMNENPRGPACEKLSGKETSIRQGIYRIIYEVRMISLVWVGKRPPAGVCEQAENG